MTKFAKKCLYFTIIMACFNLPATFGGPQANRASNGPVSDRTSSLVDAVRAGLSDSVRILLAQGEDPNAKDPTGKTALMHASSLREAIILKMLLGRGALVNAKDQKGNTALTFAAIAGNVVAAQVLLTEGATVDPRALGGWTPLMHAAFGGHVAVMEALLAKGADPNIASIDPGGTALTMAAGNGKSESVRLLIQHGANTDAKSKDDVTGLALAAYGGHADTIRVLLHGGAQVDLRVKDGLTPLMMAALGGNVEAAKALLAGGADPEAKDSGGRTALNAVKSGSADTLVLLLMAAKKKDAASQYSSLLSQTVQSTVLEPNSLEKYVFVPPGSFVMGCSPDDAQCYTDEIRQQASIDKPFWMGQTEVTVAAYKRYVRSLGKAMPVPPVFNSGWKNDKLPMTNVRWDDASSFCRWIGGRLPTELEWEYAARAATDSARYGPLEGIAWLADNSGFVRLDSDRLWTYLSKIRGGPQLYLDTLRTNENSPHEIGMLQPNGFGLYDMLGNVAEWTSGLYVAAAQLARAQTQRAATVPTLRMMRGGSFASFSRGVRVSAKYGTDPDAHEPAQGFRCVRD